MSNATAHWTDVQLVTTSNVVEVPGHNPRGEIDHTEESFTRLKESIEARGIESPIKVGPADDDGMYPIIFGHRRHAAALELGITEIPVMIDEDLDEKGRFLAAIAENRARADMTPMAEARALKTLRDEFGMKQTEAAEAMSMSERSARNRQKLLEVPEPVANAIAGGDIPLEATAHLALIAKASPTAPAALVDLIRSGNAQHGVRLDLLGDMAYVADALGQVASKSGLQIVDSAWGSAAAGSLPVATKEQRDEIKRLHRELPAPPHMQKPGFRFTAADAKKAKAQDSLLELTYTTRWGEKRTDRYITDGDLVFEMAKSKVAGMRKQTEKERADYDAREVGTVDASQSDADRQKQADKEARKQKRREEIAAKANRELLAALDAMSNPKATDVDVVRLVCAMALGDEDLAIEFANRGIGALDPEHYNAGEPDDWSATAAFSLRAELITAKNAPECLRVVLRAAIARRHALEVGGERWMTMPGPQFRSEAVGGEVKADLNVLDLIDDVADRLGVLPDQMSKAVAERRSSREEHDANTAKTAEKNAALLKAADGIEADDARVLAVIQSSAGLSERDLEDCMNIGWTALRDILGGLEKEGKVTKDGREYTAVAETVAA